MSGDTTELIEAIEEMLQATRTAREVMQQSEVRIEQYLERLRSGQPASELARGSRPAGARSEDNGALEALNRTRQRARAVTFRHLVAEGMSRKEIAELWGFSQQVVSRSINYDG